MQRSGIVKWGSTRLASVWRRSSGGFRVVAVVVLALVVLTGGIFWVALTLLMLVASVSAWVGRSLERWRSRPVVRYLDEVDATQAVLQEQLSWATREIGLRDGRIAELQREGNRGDLGGPECDRG
jgi:hypothetical protein